MGNFWPRDFDWSPFPAERKLYQTEPDVQVLAVTQHPQRAPIGEVVMVHGLEGDANAGYMQSLAWLALTKGFVAHRFHMRTCGGTQKLCNTLYHGGLTSDLIAFLRAIRPERPHLPIFLVGFSLGGNVVLKLAGERKECAKELVAGVCAASAPIDLACCAREVARPSNRIYERRFLKRMRARLLSTGRYTHEQLVRPRSLWELDDMITAPSFAFGRAENYYATQSSNNFLAGIRIPALLIQAQDDPLIPFASYSHPAFQENSRLTLLAPAHGGHLGFLSRKPPRFWADHTIIEWISGHVKRA